MRQDRRGDQHDDGLSDERQQQHPQPAEPNRGPDQYWLEHDTDQGHDGREQDRPAGLVDVQPGQEPVTQPHRRHDHQQRDEVGDHLGIPRTPPGLTGQRAGHLCRRPRGGHGPRFRDRGCRMFVRIHRTMAQRRVAVAHHPDAGFEAEPCHRRQDLCVYVAEDEAAVRERRVSWSPTERDDPSVGHRRSKAARNRSTTSTFADALLPGSLIPRFWPRPRIRPTTAR